jgi:hypothetical protein
MRKSYAARVRQVITEVHEAHPVSVAYSLELADIYGRGIDGGRGTILRNGSAADGFTGYAQPPQLFTGWNPAYQQDVGTPLTTPGGLPGTAVPLGAASPLDSAVAQIFAGTQED